MKKIIAFYPGAGGNRYMLKQQGQQQFNSGKIYDDQLLNQDPKFRYLDSDSDLSNAPDVILTHCMNSVLLKSLFPDRNIVMIVTDRWHDCLRRSWNLSERKRDRGMEHVREHAFANIMYHTRYYAQYPLDTTHTETVVDIDVGSDEFAVMMRQELDQAQDKDFDFALERSRHSWHDQDHVAGDRMREGFKSQYLDDAEQMKLRLDAVSPSMCLAKWKQVSLHLPTGLNNSCYHPPLHRINIEDIQRDPGALHNTKHKKEQRRLMLNGERPSECSYCWNMEDQGKLSDRHYRSGEPWAAVDFGKIVSSNWDDDIVPSYVEVNFNHACNLKCSYCSPQFSSSWGDEIERLGAYPTSKPHNAPEHFVGNRKPIPVREDNPYVDAFWEWWPKLYPQLTHFRMTGGEPLMDKNTYRVFDYVLAMPKPDLHLNVTSNFSVEPSLWNKYFEYVKNLCNSNIEHFMQYVSLDSGIPKHAEYIRNGMDFHRVKSRVNHFLFDIPNRNSLTFIITMNNLSVLGLQQQLEWILELRKQHSHTYQRVWFDTPVLREPAWQSLAILPESYVVQLERAKEFMQQNIETPHTRFHGFKDFEIAKLDRDIAWMRSMQHQDHSQAQADFYKFFSEHDRRRGTSFNDTFPEMKSWWAECEYHARQT